MKWTNDEINLFCITTSAVGLMIAVAFRLACQVM